MQAHPDLGGGGALAPRHPAYNGTLAVRLCAGLARRLAPPLCAFGLGLTTAGCSYQIGSLFGKDEKPAEHTGSALAAIDSSERDLSFAKEAAADLLSRGDKEASLAWENPSTGARGAVTLISEPYTEDGFLCRDFLASYVQSGKELWLRGGGCRLHQGRWEVRGTANWK